MFPWFSEVSIHYHGLARLSAITDNKAGVAQTRGSQGSLLCSPQAGSGVGVTYNL